MSSLRIGRRPADSGPGLQPAAVVSGIVHGDARLVGQRLLRSGHVPRLLALLLWSGRAGGLFKWVLVLNQVAGLVLILALWLGDRSASATPSSTCPASRCS